MKSNKNSLVTKLIQAFFVTLFLGNVLLPLATNAAASHVPSGNNGGSSGTNSSNPVQNYLYLIYKNCQVLTDNGQSFASNPPPAPQCSVYQDQLSQSLGCSGNLFQEQNVTQANGVVKQFWLIDEANYKDCLDKVGNALSQLNSQLCQNIQVNSTGWGPCADNSDSYQNKLRDSIGCSGTMYTKNNTTGVYSLNFQKYQACQNTYNTLKGYHLKVVGSDGTIQTDPTAIGSFTTSGSDNGGNGSSSSLDVQCENTGFALSWIFCKVIDGAAGGIDWIYSEIIEPLLKVNQVPITNAGNNPTFGIWSNFRIYGDIFLVLCLLIFIISESVSGGVLEAYTVRKALPRLLIAVILVNLSIYLIAFAVDLTNIVGIGIANLIQQPFKNQVGNAYTLHVDTVTGFAGGGAIIAGLLAGVFAFAVKAGVAKGGGAAASASSLVGAGIMYFLTAFLIPAFFVFLAIVATLVFRQGLILFLLFISPVAFALYCLPNTEKYFRQWWDLLFRALLIYPIVAVLFAIGNILSVTITSGGLDSGLARPIASLVGLIALFAPLFLIPFSFSIAGGVLGRVHNVAAQGTKRMSEGVLGDKNDQLSLRNRQQDKFKRARVGARADLYNTAAGKRLANVPGIGGFINRRGQRAGNLVSIYGAQAAQNEAIRPIANEETTLKAGMAKSYGDAVSRYGRDAADRWRATGLGWSTSGKIAAYNAAIADGTVFKDLKEEIGTIVDIAGTNEPLRTRLQGNGYAMNKQAGRFDLASTWGERNRLATKLANGDAPEQWEYDNATVEGLRGTSNTQIGQMKAVGAQSGSKALAAEIARQTAIIDNPSATTYHKQAAQERRSELVAKVRNMEGAGMYMPESIVSTLKVGESGVQNLIVGPDKSRGTAPAENQINRVRDLATHADNLDRQIDQARSVIISNPDSPGVAEARAFAEDKIKERDEFMKTYGAEVRAFRQQRQQTYYDPRATEGGGPGPGDSGASPGGPTGP